ncbi:MAG: L,D-transpeptidase [Bryobacteraceae bacterium]
MQIAMHKLALALVAAAEALAESNQQPRRRIVVSIADRKLAVIEDGRVVKVFATAVGAARTPTPPGNYIVVQRIPHPTWYTKRRVVPPGKANPLGTRWIGLSRKGYGIHGTNSPRSIGRSASHGCVRMHNTDVEELFEIISVGDQVEIYERPTAEMAAIFRPLMASAALPHAVE